MFITNYKEIFTNIIEVPQFIGSKIAKYCPFVGRSENGDLAFRIDENLRNAILKSPFYVKLYMKKFGL